MTDREIMQQALEALDYISRRDYDDTPLHDYELAKMRQAMSTLRERLAQPEQCGIDVLGGDWNKFALAAVAILKETK